MGNVKISFKKKISTLKLSMRKETRQSRQKLPGEMHCTHDRCLFSGGWGRADKAVVGVRPQSHQSPADPLVAAYGVPYLLA
jgi:hypothetical protein